MQLYFVLNYSLQCICIRVMISAAEGLIPSPPFNQTSTNDKIKENECTAFSIKPIMRHKAIMMLPFIEFFLRRLFFHFLLGLKSFICISAFQEHWYHAVHSAC